MVLRFDALFTLFMRMVNGIGMRGKAVQQLFLGASKEQQHRQTQDRKFLPDFDTHGAKVKGRSNAIDNKRLIPVLARLLIALRLLPLSTNNYSFNIHRTALSPLRIL